MHDVIGIGITAPRGKRRPPLPECVTSLVWSREPSATLANFIALIEARARLGR